MVVNSDFLFVGKSNMLIRLGLFGLAVLDLTVVQQEAVDAKDGFQEFTRPSKRSAILHLNRR